MVIEGSMFVIGLVVYFYLRLKVTTGRQAAEPRSAYGTMNLMVVLASILPAAISKRAAEKFDLPLRDCGSSVSSCSVLRPSCFEPSSTRR
jgi:hypothetical protein